MGVVDMSNSQFGKLAFMTEGASFGAGAQPAVANFLPWESYTPGMAVQSINMPDVHLGHPGSAVETRGPVIPGEWSLAAWLRGSGAAGTALAWRSAIMLAARHTEAVYSTENVLTVIAFANGAGDTITVVVRTGAEATGVVTTTTTALVEGVDFDNGIDDDATATAIAAAIDAIDGVSSTATLAVVTSTADAGTDSVEISGSDATAWTPVDAEDLVYYVPAENPDVSCCSYYTDGNQGIMSVGMNATSVVAGLSEEDGARFNASGQVARIFRFNKTTLFAEINDAVTALVLVDTDNISTGEESLIQTGLYIPITIDTETMIITAYNWTTGSATVTREAYGSTKATHLATATIYPYNPAPTFSFGNIPAGDDWSFTDDDTPRCILSAGITYNTGIELLNAQSCYAEAPGMQNKKPAIEGEMTAYAYDSTSYWNRRGDTGDLKKFSYIIGSAAKSGVGSIFTIHIPFARLAPTEDDPTSDGVIETTRSFTGRDALTAFGGFVWIES